MLRTILRKNAVGVFEAGVCMYFLGIEDTCVERTPASASFEAASVVLKGTATGSGIEGERAAASRSHWSFSNISGSVSCD